MSILYDQYFAKVPLNCKFTFFSIPWIPIEYATDVEKAKFDFKADVWAFSTTLWEIFSYGKKPLKVNVS